MLSLVYIFDSKVLSDTDIVPLEPVRSDNDLLNRRVSIVGLHPFSLGTSHHRMSLHEFLEAHIECDSRSPSGFQRFTVLPRRCEISTWCLCSILTTMASVLFSSD